MLPKVSIILCTCNRAESLRETLTSIGRCDVPTDLPTELVVVDNASTDHTPEVVGSAVLPNMPVRYVQEPRKGKGYAYNTGMAEAAGDVFLFTDDDVRVPTEWIEGMCRRIVNDEADAVQGGIRIAPHLLRDWLSPYHRMWLATTEHLNPANPETLVGANMAFAARILSQVSGFDPELGPGALGFGDETLFSTQARRAGYRIVGAMGTAVEHHFGELRLNRAGMAEIARKGGRSAAYIAHHWAHKTITLPGPRLLYAYLKLYAMRLWHWAECLYSEGMPAWEMERLKWIAFLEQYMQECRRARNYSRLGLSRSLGPDHSDRTAVGAHVADNAAS